MRIDQLTFTRFLAAISIVIFHYGQKSFLFNNEYVGFLFKQAYIGVSYFFILSGFVMIVAYNNKSMINAVDYFKNRFARIYPAYLLSLFLVILGQYLTININFKEFILSAFMLQAWVPGKALSFNPPGWTLSVEFLFYVLFPFLFNEIYKLISLKKLSLYVILFWIVCQIVSNWDIIFDKNIIPISVKHFINYNPLMHLNEFLLGNVAGLFYINKLKEKKKNFDFQIIAIILMIILILKYTTTLNFHNGLLALFFIPLIILISLNNGMITKVFKNKVYVFLGEISFGIYIFQYPVFSLISAYSVSKYFNINDVTFVFFIRLVVLILFSATIYKYIEKPVQSRIKNIKMGLFLSKRI